MSFISNQPSLRIIASLLVMMMGVSLHHLQTLFFLVILGQGWLLIYRVPVRFFWQRFRFIIPFIVFSLVFFPMYEPGEPLLAIGSFHFSAPGLEKALIYCFRLIFTVQTLTLLFYGMPVPVFFQTLVQLKVPGIFIELVLFTLRYMGVFREEAASMLKCLKSRGFNSGNWFSFQSYRILSKVLGSLLLRSFRRSERIYLGMLSRGYRGIIAAKHTTKIKPTELLKTAVWCIPPFGLFIWDKL